MKRRRNRQLRHQRVALVVLGLVLLAVGTAMLVLAEGLVDRLTDWAVADQAVLNEELVGTVRDNPRVGSAAALGAGALLVVIGVLWLRSQVPPQRRHGDVVVDDDTGETAGRNVVDGGALAAALEGDLERHPDVLSATAEMQPGRDLVRLRLVTADRAGTEELCSHVIRPAVDRLALVAELPRSPQLEVDLRPEEGARHVA